MLLNTEAVSDEQYQIDILQGVSRTFALTIPQLPPRLCNAVGNAYLLCRIADTIEDEPTLQAEQKHYFSRQFVDVVTGRVSPEKFANELYPLLSAKTLETERDLVKNTVRVIRVTHSFSPRQRAALERCISIMAEGMSEFQIGKVGLSGLNDLKHMDRYCYYVAGVVGEMLTELFCDYCVEIENNRKQMLELAVSFGQGLQMTNILKDIWEDRSHGACWLPQKVFQQYGFNLKNLSIEKQDNKYTEALGYLIAVAHSHLKNALTYTLLIPKKEPGMRKFCLWALGMAVLTLRKINNHRTFRSGKQVKISRRSVRLTTWVTSQFVTNDFLLKLLFSMCASALPKLPESLEPSHQEIVKQ